VRLDFVIFHQRVSVRIFIVRARGRLAFAPRGNESEAPDATEVVADEGAEESARVGLEDVNLAVGHADDDVAVVNSERGYNTVVRRGVR
jgi:hypothetical protein